MRTIKEFVESINEGPNQGWNTRKADNGTHTVYFGQRWMHAGHKTKTAAEQKMRELKSKYKGREGDIAYESVELTEELKDHESDAGNSMVGHEDLLHTLVKKGYKLHGAGNVSTGVGSESTRVTSPTGERNTVSTRLVRNGVVKHTVHPGHV